MKGNAGFSHVLMLLLVLIVVVVSVAGVIIYSSSGRSLTSVIQKPSSQQPNVALQTKYQNPFDQSSQYANPFSQYKNPFDVGK